MKSRFLPNPESDSVVNYYLLPLTGSSIKDFGDNFVSAKTNTQGTKVFVEVRADTYSDRIHKNKVILDGKTYIVHSIKEEFVGDARLIIHGRYKHISDKAKLCIVNKSGLTNKKIKGVLYASKLLLALYGNQNVVDFMYEALHVGEDFDKDLYDSLKKVSLVERIVESDFI